MLSGLRHLGRVSRLAFSQKIVKMSSSSSKAQFVFPDDQPLVRLDASTAWGHLTGSEKLYSHYISRASWWVPALSRPDLPRETVRQVWGNIKTLLRTTVNY